MVDLKSNEHTTKQKIAPKKGAQERIRISRSSQSFIVFRRVHFIEARRRTSDGLKSFRRRLDDFAISINCSRGMKQRNKATAAADCHAKTVEWVFHFLHVFWRKVFFNQKTASPDPCAQEVFFLSRDHRLRPLYAGGLDFLTGVDVFARLSVDFFRAVFSPFEDSSFSNVCMLTKCSFKFKNLSRP